MVNTTTEILTVNGVVLNTLAKNVESLTGRLRAPSHRTSNIVIPGKHGEMRVPNKKFQANTISLPMWVVGSDDDGGIPDGSTARREFFKRVNELVALFKGPDLLDVRWTKADGSIRQCFAEALDVMNFTTDAAPTARVGVVLTMPDPFWQDLNTTTQSLTGTGTSFNPTNFAGGSAPIEDMVYRIVGPWDNPRATFSDGTFFQYSGSIPAGQGIIVDSGEWELRSVGGFTPDYRNLSHDGRDAYWGALPAAVGAVTLAGGARTSASVFEMTGRRKYLVG